MKWQQQTAEELHGTEAEQEDEETGTEGLFADFALVKPSA
jgi:hypothetical protein